MRVTFYHQVRADGGRRTGLEVDGQQGLESFVPAGDNHDPALRWYIDVSWEVADAPTTRSEARAWYAVHRDDVQVALDAAADRLAVGLDAENSATRFDVPTPAGSARVAVAAQRRLDGLSVAEGIRSLLADDVPGLASGVEASCAAG